MNIFSYINIVGCKMKIPSEMQFEKLSKSIKALSDAGRLKIVINLLEKEMCVGEISESLKISQSATSHSLRILKDANVLKCRKQGNVIYYSICDSHIETLVKMLIEHVNCQ